MQRFQASWLVETVLDNVTELDSELSWFFPCLWKFMPLEWLSHRNAVITMNVPVHSQAVLYKSWFSNYDAFPQEEVMKAFNQILMKTIDININPFKAWLDTYFTKQQLDYLLYWREAANELTNEAIRDSFLAIVFQVMNYWLSNNKVGAENLFPPDEILAYYYKRYRSFREHTAKFNITERVIESLNPEKCNIVVFNLVFGDEDYLEDEPLLVYNAWINGYTDTEESKRSFGNELKQYIIDFGTNKNFDFYKKMTENAKTAAFCWSGTGISPNLYQRMLVEPLQKLLSDRYKTSKLVFKPIDSVSDSYDYILLFY